MRHFSGSFELLFNRWDHFPIETVFARSGDLIQCLDLQSICGNATFPKFANVGERTGQARKLREQRRFLGIRRLAQSIDGLRNAPHLSTIG